MNNELGRKITSLTIMTIMIAGGMTIAAPGMMPVAAAENQLLFVSAENATFGNTFSQGQIVEIIKPSALRQKAECEYFSRCGGCSLQHFKSDFYKGFKRKNIDDIVWKR